jgi:hypothetical protein
MQLATIDAPTTPPTPPGVPHNPPVTGPALATFSYVIRSPHNMAHYGVIEAHAWPNPTSLPASGSFDDAVAAAKQLARRSAYDGIHGLPINQCVGVLQSATGALSLAPLGGDHRERTGPLFVDGRFFDATTLSLQVVRATSDLIAVVGTDRVMDLRETGSAAVIVPAEH